ncbi:hypothetical protein ACHAQH_005334 [Verticillium albo-atrum]
MVTLDEVSGLLQKQPDTEITQLTRAPSSYKPLTTFLLKKDRPYQQQFADVYFLRLTNIKPAVEKIASEAWHGTVIGGEPAKQVNRVLDVRQGELCWVAGTVYMEMRLKPNILEDVSKDRWISAPISTQKYYSDDDEDQVMIEDESGRIRLVGDVLKTVNLVTGCIIAVMGTENANGELEVIDIKFADVSPQSERWNLTKPPANGKSKVKDEDEEMEDSPKTLSNGKKIAIVSGLSFSGHDPSYAVELDLLLEYLLGEALDPSAQNEASKISRLIIAGNSISLTEAPKLDPTAVDKKPVTKKYGYDSSSYNPIPSQLLDDFLAELLPSIPITLLPGADDPANASYPQQPIHTAMFPKARAWSVNPDSTEPGWFDNTTNPWEGEVDGWRVLGTGGQNVDDVFKYVDSEDRLGMMEAMWSYPFQDDDPFVIKSAPHLYFVGCQPEFSTKVIQGPEGQQVRLITVPSFSESKEIVLVDTETLEVTKVRISAAN